MGARAPRSRADWCPLLAVPLLAAPRLARQAAAAGAGLVGPGRACPRLTIPSIPSTQGRVIRDAHQGEAEATCTCCEAAYARPHAALMQPSCSSTHAALGGVQTTVQRSTRRECIANALLNVEWYGFRIQVNTSQVNDVSRVSCVPHVQFACLCGSVPVERSVTLLVC